MLLLVWRKRWELRLLELAEHFMDEVNGQQTNNLFKLRLA